MRILRSVTVALSLASGLLLSACQPRVSVPTEVGVCWHMVALEDGKTRFNPLSRNVPDIEHCAAALEAMRIENGRLGQNRDEVIGGYQGSFIWLEREGVFISQTLNGARYLALVPSGDGRLVIPGSVEQPPPPPPGAAPASK